MCAKLYHSALAEVYWATGLGEGPLEECALEVTVRAGWDDENDTFTQECGDKTQVNGTVQKIKTTRKVFGKAAVVKTVPSNLTCYQRTSGTVALGHVPFSKCRSLIRENDLRKK